MEPYIVKRWYMEVTLIECAQPLDGKVYRLDEANAFVFGTAPHCSMTVAEDGAIAPEHFRIIVEPPVVWFRDCGSMAGTYYQMYSYGIDDSWCLFREPCFDPYTADSHLNTIIMTNKDQIRVGDYWFEIFIDMPPVCLECGRELHVGEQLGARRSGEAFHCMNCYYPEIDRIEDALLLENFSQYICDMFGQSEFEMISDYLHARVAREVWLKGIHNNAAYYREPLDFIKITARYKKAFKRYIGEDMLNQL